MLQQHGMHDIDQALFTGHYPIDKLNRDLIVIYLHIYTKL